MLTEERKNQILRLVQEKGSVSVQELMLALQTSESTIRRDIIELAEKNLLVKVRGGAMAMESVHITADALISEREDLHQQQKKQIAQYAASLIVEGDIVYLDAGTTTGFILDYLSCKNVIFVTNAIAHARCLCHMGYQVYLPGGMVKIRTEAVIGSQTCGDIARFHFTKGFFGANGVTVKEGFTTPDVHEAMVKEMAIKHTRDRYVLCDSSKFEKISSVTFAVYDMAKVITDEQLPVGYRQYDNIVIAT
jgi:DeoR family fructose operon transcriptional repressor